MLGQHLFDVLACVPTDEYERRRDLRVEVDTVLYADEQARRLTGGVSTPEETRAAIEGYMDLQARAGYSFWAVIERDTGALVGEAGLKPFEDGGADVELGYAFGPAAWGRGYATEAARAIVAEAFGPLDLSRVVAVTRVENTASQHVLAKLGFQPAGRRDVYGGDLPYFVLERG